jgi:hypothetical protein
MMLPGGILRDGVRRREFSFRPLTGAVELALAEAAGADIPLPARVTGVLNATLEQAGGEEPLPATVAELSVADRQYLMGRLAMELGRGEQWLTTVCGRCGERFDFAVNYGELPVKEAGEGYPFAQVETTLGPCRFRVPTGKDQEFLAGIDDDAEALRVLVSCCLTDFPGRMEEGMCLKDGAGTFSPDDVARIEAALEAVAPEVAVSVQAACPDCGSLHVIDLDPYGVLHQYAGGSLLQEIHTIAATYHWGEAEILALPRERRRRYLELIDRARGMAR